jgi:predicted esterase
MKSTIQQTLILVLTAALLTGSACAQNRLTNTRFETVKLDNGKFLPYAIHLPNDYDPTKAYPTIIGPGDGVKEDSPGYYWHGRPSDFGWLIVETPAHFATDAVSQMSQLLDHLNAQYNVEGDKFHMVGFSANSANSFRVGIALADRFHSLVGVAGFPRQNPTGKDLARVKHTKFYFIVGDRDQYWMNASQKAHDYLTSKGIDSTMKIIKNGGHVLKEIDGQPFIDLMEAMR